PGQQCAHGSREEIAQNRCRSLQRRRQQSGDYVDPDMSAIAARGHRTDQSEPQDGETDEAIGPRDPERENVTQQDLTAGENDEPGKEDDEDRVFESSAEFVGALQPRVARWNVQTRGLVSS